MAGFEKIVAELKGKAVFLELFDKALLYTEMLKDAFGFTAAISGLTKIDSVYSNDFWVKSLQNILALKDSVAEVASDSGYREDFLVYGARAAEVLIVLDKFLTTCELECMLRVGDVVEESETSAW